MSIPFRFKAGADPPSHHHRPSTKTGHKAFKTRHATKSALRDQAKGKLEKPLRKTPQQQTQTKWDRRNQAKQARQTKHQATIRDTSLFHGPHGAPRIVTIIPLCPRLDLCEAVRSLNEAADAQSIWPLNTKQIRVRIERFKQTLLYLPISSRDPIESLDACRVADYVLFLLRPDEPPDDIGENILRLVESQGISSTMAMVQGLDATLAPKKRTQITTSLKSIISRFLPAQEKVLSLDSPNECANAIRSLCAGAPKGVRWRDERSWLLVEESLSSRDTNMVLTGVVRGRSLKANRLLQVGDWGHFQIASIKAAPLPQSHKRKDHPEQDALLDSPDGEQEPLDELAPYEASMTDIETDFPDNRKGVLLDDHHYFSDDETHLPEQPTRLPKGTSKYQSAWYLGDVSDSGSDYDDSEGDIPMDDAAPLPQDGMDVAVPETVSEYPQSEMFADPSPHDEAAQIAEYRASRKTEAEEDREFPDEIELQPHVLARERLARYRGLRSLKTSPWQTHEDRGHEPEDWDRLLPVPDYRKSRRQAADDLLVGGVACGTRVQVELINVPAEMIAYKGLLTAFSLLRHEQKRTVVNVSMTLSSQQTSAIRSKQALIMQCGSRRLCIKPIFSQLGNTPNDVHKFLRYLHPGQTAVASFIGPVTWGPIPALFFDEGLNLIGTGTNLPPSTGRVVAKRAILTGHPYQIHKKVVTVRYMFFNAEDVAWFAAMPLWTRRGRAGRIRQSLGTHGYFKANFDGALNPQDAIGISLYKRVFPRLAIPWTSPADSMDAALSAS